MSTANPLFTADNTLGPIVISPGQMTEEQFVAWCTDDVRAEWVDGEVFMMSPVTEDHDDLNGWFLAIMRHFVEHFDLGIVRGPGFQVRLAGQRRRRIPDLLFVSHANRHKLRRTWLEGAPDLAVEIVSPESVARDWREKYLEYQTAGVLEYWIIDLMSQRVEVYVLDAQRQYQRVAEHDGVLRSTVLPGFFVKTEWLWQATRPKLSVVLTELRVWQSNYSCNE